MSIEMQHNGRRIVVSDNYLAHSAAGTTWGKHKYISKETKNGKTVYNYSLAGNKTADDKIKYVRQLQDVVKKAEEVVKEQERNVRDAQIEYMRYEKIVHPNTLQRLKLQQASMKAQDARNKLKMADENLKRAKTLLNDAEADFDNSFVGKIEDLKSKIRYMLP